MSTIIEIQGLTKKYGDLTALNDLTLNIEEGEVFGFIGPNGAGKTTTMRILTTLLKPTSGKAWVAGESVIDNPRAVRRHIGYMPDFFGVYDDMKVWEYLDFFAACYDIPQATRLGMVDDLLALVDLGHKKDILVGHCGILPTTQSPRSSSVIGTVTTNPIRRVEHRIGDFLGLFRRFHHRND